MTIKQQGGIFGRNPTFNNVDVEGTLTVNGEPISDFGTMAQQDANNVNIDGGSIDNVTIGGSTAAIAVTSKLLTSTGTAGNIQTDSAGNRISMTRPGANYLVASTSGGTLNFGTNGVDTQAYIDTSGNLNCLTGNVVMANGKGIDFSATSGTGTSELFDDYEEGTWTPVIGGTGGQSGQSYSVQQGNYTKIGDQVICHFRARFDGTSGAKGTITTYVNIQGLPFTSNNSSANYRSGGFCFVWSGMATSVTTINLGMENNSTSAGLQVITSAATATSLIQTADVSDSLQLQGFISYKV
jgi:hypothetical protein